MHQKKRKCIKIPRDTCAGDHWEEAAQTGKCVIRADSSSTDLIQQTVENRLLRGGESQHLGHSWGFWTQSSITCREQLLSHRRGDPDILSVDSSWNIPQSALSWKSKYSSHGQGLLLLRAGRKQPKPPELAPRVGES